MISFSFALLSLGLLQSPLSGPQSSPSAGLREALPSGIAGLSPQLEAALFDILTVEAKLLELAQPIDADGNPITDQKRYEAMLHREGGAFKIYMDVQLARFDMQGMPMPPPRSGADMIRFDAGFQAAKALLENDAEFQSTQLLDIFHEELIQADPIWNSDDALMYQQSGRQAGKLAPLTNAGALGYLVWGMLGQEAYWDDESHDREAFITDVLLRGFESHMHAALVSRALEAPMRAPRKELASQRRGRGIAGPYEKLRAKVGFTKGHEALLEADLELLKDIQQLPGSAPELELGKHRVETANSGKPHLVLNRRGHLKVWLPKMLAQVRQELYPLGASKKMRHSKSIDERMYYWRLVFQKYGFITAREMLLAEIRNVMGSMDMHPHAERINELLALQTAGPLTQELQAELDRLQRERRQERDQLLTASVDIMARSGIEHHHALVFQTLLHDLPELLLDIHPFARDQIIYTGWLGVGAAHSPLTMQAVSDHFSGARADLKPMVLGVLINNLSIQDYPGSAALLDEILSTGTPVDVANVMMNPGWIPAERFTEITHSMLASHDAPQLEMHTKVRIGSSFITALGRHPDKAQAREFLTQLVEEGRLSNPDSSVYLGRYINSSNRRSILNLMSPEVIAKYQSMGKIALDIF